MQYKTTTNKKNVANNKQMNKEQLKQVIKDLKSTPRHLMSRLKPYDALNWTVLMFDGVIENFYSKLCDNDKKKMDRDIDRLLTRIDLVANDDLRENYEVYKANGWIK